MTDRVITKLVHAGEYAAEVEVSLIDAYSRLAALSFHQ